MASTEVPGSEHGVVGPVRTDVTGRRGPTRRQAAGSQWRRSSRGLYVPADVPLTPEQRVVEAGYLVPRHGAVTGWGALRWQGGEWFAGTAADATLIDVDLAVPAHRVRTQPGFHMTGDRFNPHEAVNIDGIWVASPAMATYFTMRYAANHREATIALDMALYADLVTLEEMVEYVDARPAYTGVPQARRALSHADENSWSPMESRMRLTWAAAGFGQPLCNRPVFDLLGNHVGTPDLIDPATGVVGQYDGAVHLVGDQPSRDAVRDGSFGRVGIETVVARAGDLATQAWAAELHDAYLRAGRRPVSERRWTLDLPEWWVPTFTVDQRRRLSVEQRARWLRYRDAA